MLVASQVNALMGPALIIAGIQLRQRARDRSIYIIGIAVPLVLAAILSFALSDVSDDEFSTAYAIADEDGGPVAASLAAVVRGLDFAEVTEAASAGEAEQLVADGEVRAAFVVPAGFSASVQSGEGGRLQVIADPEATISAQIAESIAQSFAADLNAVQLSVATALADGGPPDPAAARQAVELARATPSPAVIDPAVAADRQAGPQTFFAVGMAVFFLFFTVEFGVRSLLEERQIGTMARLLAAPVRPWSVIAGKAIASFVVGLISIAVLIVASDLLLGAQWGDPLGVALLALVGVLAAMGVTAVVATLAKTPDQATSYASVVAVTFGILGGAFFPLGGGLLAAVSLITPHAWLLRGFRDLASGAAVGDVLAPAAVVLAFALVTGAAAVRRAGRLVERP